MSAAVAVVGTIILAALVGLVACAIGFAAARSDFFREERR